ncbi:winged helix-turn-helix domain-containing protein [Pleionea sediminis]|uniref:winged helix-turn-helix domain-containing protein n=1 Tax=Pleionea sediminis TaxID=2569479 RepID=UPI00118577F3|nr:winged helix-turn-helix domain-containing protein [Pleionea sediminis]
MINNTNDTLDDEQKIETIHDKWLLNNQYKVDFSNQSIYHPDHGEQNFRKKTAEVLQLLIKNKNKCVSSDMFLESIWGGKYITENSLKRSIWELRALLQDDNKTKIKTVPRRGYLLDMDIVEFSDDSNQNNSENQKNEVSSLKGDNALKRYYLPLFVCITVIALATVAYYSFGNHLNSLNDYDYSINTIIGIEKEQLDNQYAELVKSIDIDVSKESDYLELADKYKHFGFFKQAKLMYEKIIQRLYLNIESNPEVYAKAHFELVDILLRQDKRIEALLFAQKFYDLVQKEYFSETDKALGAFWLGKAYLYCVYPMCDREDAYTQGKQFAHESLSRLESLENNKEELLARALVLNNHFEKRISNKEVILNRAIKLLKSLDDPPEVPLANALESMARAYYLLHKEVSLSHQYLIEALMLKEKALSEYDTEIAKTNWLLGEYYLFVGNFDKATNYLQSALQIVNRHEEIRISFKVELYLYLAKSLFYSNKLKLSHVALDKATDLIEKYSDNIGYYMQLEMIALKIRFNHPDKIFFSDKELAQYKYVSIRSRNQYSWYVLEHEALSQLLISNPKNVNVEQYLSGLDRLLGSFFNFNRYIIGKDVDLIIARSEKHCEGISQQFCDSIKQIFRNYRVSY